MKYKYAGLILISKGKTRFKTFFSMIINKKKYKLAQITETFYNLIKLELKKKINFVQNNQNLKTCHLRNIKIIYHVFKNCVV